MKSDVETLSPTSVRLAVEVPFDDLNSDMAAAFGRIALQVSIPGFRKGKVPARVIEQRVGREAVLQEAVNDALPRLYQEAMRTHDLIPVGRPEVEITDLVDGERFAFTAEVEVRPTFSLPDLAGITVVVPPAEPTQEDVDAQLEGLRGRFATLTEVDRAAADGDVLLIDISGTTPQGDPVDDLLGSALSYQVGSDGLLPGADAVLLGAKAGQTVTLDFTPGNGDWAGIPLVVTIAVTTVRERTLPPLDDSFAQLASEFDTADELRADVRRRLQRIARLEQGTQARARLHEQLLEQIDMPLPAGFVAAQVAEHFEQDHGPGHEDTPEHRVEVEEQVRTSLKSDFILDALAEQREIGVTEEELSMWLVQQAPRYGMTPDAFAKALVEAGQVPSALQEIRRAKALAAVLEDARVVDEAGAAVDLKALDEILASPVGGA